MCLNFQAFRAISRRLQQRFTRERSLAIDVNVETDSYTLISRLQPVQLAISAPQPTHKTRDTAAAEIDARDAAW